MIKRGLLSLFVLVIFLMSGGAGPVRAASQVVAPRHTTDNNLTFASVAGPYFFSGQRVVVAENYRGNVLVAGQDVLVTGTIQGNLLAVGGHVRLVGEVRGTVVAAGGTVSLENHIESDAFIAGAEVRQAAVSTIDGALAAVGQSSDLQGKVSGRTWWGGQHLRLNAKLGQDLQLVGQSLVVAPLASVAGRVRGQLHSAPVIQAPSQWAQTPEWVVTPERASHWSRAAAPAVFSGLWLTKQIFRVAGSLAVALAVWWVAQKWLTVASTNIVKQPWPVFGRGVAVVGLGPVLILFLAITGIGLSLSILVAAVWLILLWIAQPAVALAAGRFLLPKQTALIQLALGTLLVCLVTAVPVIGCLLKLIVVIMGAGAWVQWAVAQWRPSRS